MVATAHIATAAQIDPWYLPRDANVHPYLTHCSFGLRESVPLPKLHPIGSSVFAGFTSVIHNHINRETDHATSFNR